MPDIAGGLVALPYRIHVKSFVHNMVKSCLKKEKIVRNSEEKPLPNRRIGGIIPV